MTTSPGAYPQVDAFDPTDPTDPNAVTDPDHEIGRPYVGWREGELDLHFIETGVAESAFYVLPDGTTALVDAGDRDPTTHQNGFPIVPDASRRSGEWVARYIERVCPGLETIDYVVASHFHRDHVGDSTLEVPFKGLGGDGDYKLTGIPEVGERYRFGTAFDRAYPDYDRPIPCVSPVREYRDNLVKFWDYAEEKLGLKREKFEVGALDQLKLVHAPEKYDFHIRNICANGVIWNPGEGRAIDYFERYPLTRELNNSENTRENMLSIAFVAQYGAFRFYTGGDVMGVATRDDGTTFELEPLVGQAAGPVDVCKANHHSYKNAMKPGFVNAVAPRVFVVCAWNADHFQDVTATTMCDDSDSGYPGPRVICPTRVCQERLAQTPGRPWRRQLVETGGHIVVKAYDGGSTYKVYYLTSQDESMTVKLVLGPFRSRGTRKS